MRQLVSLAVSAAIIALGVSLTVQTGCASKPPPPEAPEPTQVPPKPAQVSPEPTQIAAEPAKVAPTTAVRATVGSRGAGGGSSGVANPISTSEERRAALDQRLNQSLSAFDAKLRSEQQRVAQERDARQTAVLTVASANNGGPGGGGSGADSATGDSPAAAHGGTASRSGRAGDLKSDKATGVGGASANG